MSERPEEPNKASDEESLLPIDEHIEEGHDAEGRKVRHRGIYLLPNLFTTAALFSGFYAIINGMSGQFANAAIAIFVAMVLDGLDGRVARLTNTQSAFGAEYDSLSDMVAFGVAPALVAFEWALGSLGKVGWMVAFIYVAGAALRLARFNTQVGKADKRYFIGLASPAAAALVAGTVWAFSDFEIQGAKVAFLVALLVAAAGVLMVSNIKYHSFAISTCAAGCRSWRSLSWCWPSPWSLPTRRASSCCCSLPTRPPVLCNTCCNCVAGSSRADVISNGLRSLLAQSWSLRSPSC